MSKDEYLWSQKYRPRTIDEVILPEEILGKFRKFAAEKNCPNLILAGPPGIGKTTLALALMDEIDADFTMINGSLNAGIDTLRNEIANYASSMSLEGGRKFVLIDEADFLNPNSVQPALRGFVEEFSRNCGFILTCNYRNRIIPALSESRFSVVEFDVPRDGDEQLRLVKKFHKRLMAILDENSVSYDKKVLVALIAKYYPDFRRAMNELQLYAAGGAIDTGILVSLEDANTDRVIELLKSGDFSELIKWLEDNKNIDTVVLMDRLYHALKSKLAIHSLAGLVMVLAEYTAQAPMVPDKELNMAACFAKFLSQKPEFVG